MSGGEQSMITPHNLWHNQANLIFLLLMTSIMISRPFPYFTITPGSIWLLTLLEVTLDVYAVVVPLVDPLVVALVVPFKVLVLVVVFVVVWKVLTAWIRNKLITQPLTQSAQNTILHFVFWETYMKPAANKMNKIQFKFNHSWTKFYIGVISQFGKKFNFDRTLKLFYTTFLSHNFVHMSPKLGKFINTHKKEFAAIPPSL